jgi:hypothetical protein
MQIDPTKFACGLAIGAAFAVAAPVRADDVRVHVEPGGHVHETVRVGSGGHVRETIDRFHRVPPGVRVRGGHFTVRVNPFRAHLGWRVNRFSPRERFLWTHGRWWHGRWHGRLGWWWWANGGWFFYDAPVYPYPDYVSETYYDVPGADYSDYWYYCRDPEGYYPYVRQCNGQWQPVPAQPGAGYGGGPSGGPDEYDDRGGPPDESGPPDQGPPDDYGPSDQGPPDEEGPPDDYGPDDHGPPPR